MSTFTCGMCGWSTTAAGDNIDAMHDCPAGTWALYTAPLGPIPLRYRAGPWIRSLRFWRDPWKGWEQMGAVDSTAGGAVGEDR